MGDASAAQRCPCVSTRHVARPVVNHHHYPLTHCEQVRGARSPHALIRRCRCDDGGGWLVAAVVSDDGLPAVP